MGEYDFSRAEQWAGADDALDRLRLAESLAWARVSEAEAALRAACADYEAARRQLWRVA